MTDFEDIRELSSEELSLESPGTCRPGKRPQMLNLVRSGLWLGPAYLFSSTAAAWLAWQIGFKDLLLWWVPIVSLGILVFVSWFRVRKVPVGRLRLLCWRGLFVLVGISAALAWSISFDFFLRFPLDWQVLAGLSLVTFGILSTLAAALHWFPVFFASWLTFVLGLGRFPLEMTQPDVQIWTFWGIAIAIFVFGAFSAVLASRLARQETENKAIAYELAVLHSQIQSKGDQLERASDDLNEIEGQLTVAREEVTAAIRSKTEFLATMSHEIRTPMNSVLPILEILRDTSLEADQHELALTAYNSSQQLLRIIDDILDFAKAESGKLELERIEIDLFELVDSITGLMWESADRKGLHLGAEIERNVPDQLHGDPIRIRQILTNLISNAIKFTESGGIEIDISVHRGTRKEVELLFSIKDSGIGMSRETVKKLFHSFTQADASTTRKYGGTGLGLVISKRLVELMGGRIGVNSREGEGSVFWFTLPMRRSVRNQPVERRSLEGLRVLSLLHDATIAGRLGGWMDEWRMSVDVADSPSDALTRIDALVRLGESWIQHLLVVDALDETRLRQVEQLLRNIRNNKRMARLRIMVLIKSGGDGDRLKLQYDVVTLSSPIKKEILKNALNRLFDVDIPIRSPEKMVDSLATSRITPSESPAKNRHVLKQIIASDPRKRFQGHVLLVEDNPVNLAVAQRLLTRYGLSCVTALDGKEALELLNKEKIDLVFMDCQMPVMDGYEATRLIRQQEVTSDSRLPVIAMTANAMQGDKEKCLAAGMDDYLSKPVSMDSMREMLGRWLPGQDQQDEQQSGPQTTGSSRPDSGEREHEVAVDDVLDHAILDELKEVMEGDCAIIIRTYLKNTPELIQGLKQSTTAKGMVLPAHSLKSSSANVGAMRLSAVAKEVEYAAKADNLEAASLLLEQLLREYQSAIEALQAWVSD